MAVSFTLLLFLFFNCVLPVFFVFFRPPFHLPLSFLLQFFFPFQLYSITIRFLLFFQLLSGFVFPDIFCVFSSIFVGLFAVRMRGSSVHDHFLTCVICSNHVSTPIASMLSMSTYRKHSTAQRNQHYTKQQST